MKSVALVTVFFATLTAMAKPPELPIDQAVALAHESLNGRGLTDKYFIASVVLEPVDVRRSSFRWAVSWSESIPVSGVKKEIGLEIAMDGSVVRIVKGPARLPPTVDARR